MRIDHTGRSLRHSCAGTCILLIVSLGGLHHTVQGNDPLAPQVRRAAARAEQFSQRPVQSPIQSGLLHSRGPRRPPSVETASGAAPADAVQGTVSYAAEERVETPTPLPELLDLEPYLVPADGPSQSISFAMVLARGRAANWTIALARNRALAADLDQERAGLLWLPDAQGSFGYLYHDGNIQRAIGEIIKTQRQSLFVGGGPSLSLDSREAVFAPRIAEAERCAADADAHAVTNQTLQELVNGYCDLVAARTAVAVAAEAVALAGELVRQTEAFERNGLGLPSDVARAQARLETRRQELVVAEERAALASIALAVPLRLDPRIQLVPSERAITVLPLLEPDTSVDQLVYTALTARPEIARHHALVQAALQRLRRQQYGPLFPTVNLSYLAGGFGGGYADSEEGLFATFGGRDDLTATLVWELPNLGFGQSVRNRREQADVDAAQLSLVRQTDQIVGEVVAAHQVFLRRRAQAEAARTAVEKAMHSYQLNARRIQGGAGLPIEVVQAIQTLVDSRLEYLNAITQANKAQMLLLTAIGRPADSVFYPGREGVLETR